MALMVWRARQDTPRERLTLDELGALLADGEVETATIRDADNQVIGELVDGTRYRVDFPATFADELTQQLLDAEVDFDTDRQATSVWRSLLVSLLPTVLIVAVFLWFIMSMQGGGRMARFTKAKPRQFSKDEPKVTFADVAGADEAVEELEEVKDFLANPARFEQMGAKIPRGVLLYGPPGTGKTLLARAVAGEAGAPFFSISGSDFVEMFVGVGASRVRSLFQQAKSSAPAIIFVDEIDAVGRHRGAGLGGGHDEREQTLNQLLVEMDGFDVRSGVIMIAATNRPDILDPALLRPGRFDRQVAVERPDLAGREEILRVHVKGKPLADDIDLSVLARRTPGFTGADLANLVNEAALLAARRGRDWITMAEADDAIDRVIAGPERKSRIMTEREKRVIAYHEAGHALVGHLLPNTDPILKVSIIARGRALGWTLAVPENDKSLHTRSELRDRLAMLLAGRTAEELVFGDPTTGAANDIEEATKLAKSMVTEFGMSDSLGLRLLGHKQGEPFLGRDVQSTPDYSEEVAGVIDDEVRALLEEAHDEASELLTRHRSVLDELASSLVENETLYRAELLRLFGPLEPDGVGNT